MATQKIKIEVRNGDINKALKLFKRKTMDSGHLQELKERQEYTKPTTVRRKEKQQAVRAEKRRIATEREQL